jgi:hypothetical protein
MTAETQSMICSLKTWLPQIVGIGFSPMTALAWRDMPLRTEVMTGGTVVPHLRHTGMELVVKVHRLEKLLQLTQEHRIGSLHQAM